MKNFLLLISIAYLAGGCMVVPPDDVGVRDRDAGRWGYDNGGYNRPYYGGGDYGDRDRRDRDRYEHGRDERRWRAPQPAPTPANAAQGVYMGSPNAPRPMPMQPRPGPAPRMVNAPPRGPLSGVAGEVMGRQPQPPMRGERRPEARYPGNRYGQGDDRERRRERRDERRDERGRGGEQDR